MGLRKILTDKDPALHKVCKPVEKFDRKLHKLLDDMAETLAEANGVGLAAPQVGILRRVVIVDTGDGILELVNPELIATDGEQEGAEGCHPTQDLVLFAQLGVSADTGAGLTAQSELAHHQSDTDSDHQDQVDHQEGEAAGGAHLVGEAPQVAQADGRADGGHEEAEGAAPLTTLFDFIHCVSFSPL